MIEQQYKEGDRVKVIAPDDDLLKYEGMTEAFGTVIRFRAGKVRVEIDGTSSQDTEGLNSYSDFDLDQVTLIAPRTSYGDITKENTASGPTTGAVSGGVTITNMRISNSPADQKRNALLNKAMRYQMALNKGGSK